MNAVLAYCEAGRKRASETPATAGGSPRRPVTIGTFMHIESASLGLPAYSATLPREPESAHSARVLVTAALNCWTLDDVQDAAWLVVTELVANAVAHARRDHVRVTITRQSSSCVRVAVTDFSKALPYLRQANDDEESGRGLTLVNRLTAGNWGATPLRWGKSVWADLEAEGKGAP